MSRLHDKASNIKAAILNHFRSSEKAQYIPAAKQLNTVVYNPLFDAADEPKWHINLIAESKSSAQVARMA